MKRFRTTSHIPSLDGKSFEVDDDATENEIALAAHEAIVEYLDYGWEEIGEEGEDE